MFELPNLPYAHDALEPVISQATMHLHHGKHHKRYFDVMNQMLQESGAKPASLEDVIRGAVGQAKLFNNSAQAWNHTFFWECMSAPGQKASGDLAAAIERDFGGLEQLKAQFVAKGVGHFGSGWVWLAARCSLFHTGVGAGTIARIRSTTWRGLMLSAIASKLSTNR